MGKEKSSKNSADAKKATGKPDAAKPTHLSGGNPQIPKAGKVRS